MDKKFTELKGIWIRKLVSWRGGWVEDLVLWGRGWRGLVVGLRGLVLLLLVIGSFC